MHELAESGSASFQKRDEKLDAPNAKDEGVRSWGEDGRGLNEFQYGGLRFLFKR